MYGAFLLPTRGKNAKGMLTLRTLSNAFLAHVQTAPMPQSPQASLTTLTTQSDSSHEPVYPPAQPLTTSAGLVTPTSQSNKHDEPNKHAALLLLCL